jgi:hypothetical protein
MLIVAALGGDASVRRGHVPAALPEGATGFHG